MTHRLTGYGPGYRLYRAPSADGPFTLLNPTVLLTATSYFDTTSRTANRLRQTLRLFRPRSPEPRSASASTDPWRGRRCRSTKVFSRLPSRSRIRSMSTAGRLAVGW